MEAEAEMACEVRCGWLGCCGCCARHSTYQRVCYNRTKTRDMGEVEGRVLIMAQSGFDDVRPSPIAGQWYSGSPEQLAVEVDRMLDSATLVDVPGQITGLIAPHAGYIYSGPIAAQAFCLVRGMKFERVIVVSPMHHAYIEPILTTAHEAYYTPLGEIPVDRDTLNALARRLPLTAVRRDPEHSLEIELPFLQRALGGGFRLVPLMLRDQSYEVAAALGEAVVEELRDTKEVLFVASSDLSHFYKDAEARKLDRVMLDHVEAFDPESVIRAEDEGKAFACGRAAIATVLVATRAMGANQVQIVGYGTSADTSGDSQRVVGYGAAAIYKNRSDG